MLKERVEEYLGAIYRLRAGPGTPVPLSELTEYFGFSPVSVHEMVQKLDDRGWVVYHPYRGVTLTEKGEGVAKAVLRRHRLWERFLTDSLGISWDEAHVIAGRLEHVATESVTERLAAFLGEPKACPHGGPIPPGTGPSSTHRLRSLEVGTEAEIVRIAPETSELLRRVAERDLLPGRRVEIVAQEEAKTALRLDGADETVEVPAADAAFIWVEVM
ncbi:MAG: metal-dependent transcriptional regulator [Anaerolineae bacterium]